MKSTPHDLVSAVASDPALAQLCDEIIERLQAGDGVDLASLALEHPEHADQLRRLLPALEALVDLGASAAGNPSRVTTTQGTSDLAPRVLGDYRILREVGRGGMGVVYEAEQRSLNRRVALKVLPMAAALDVRQFQRFQLEAQAAACLHHNNIVPVFAVGTEGGVPFYAMQYIEGRTLADVVQELRRAEGLEHEPPTRESGEVARLADLTTTALARSLVSAQPTASRIDAPGPNAPTEAYDPSPSPLSPGEGHPVPVRKPSKTASSTRTRDYCRSIANLGLQAAEALDHAHTRGILHRDIKPANLLLDAEGRLWVTDFGLAQIQGNLGLTLSGDVLGTLRYMSPEQALAKRVVIDGRTDVYSLGVTLYELLTLRPAFDGKDRAEILRKIESDEPTPLRKLNASVPQDVETIVHKALAKEPSGRYATAKELADDLRNYLEARSIRARRPSLLDRAAKWTRRHTASVAAASVILVLVMIGLATSTILISREQRRTASALEQAEARFQFARKAVDEMYTQVAEKWLEQQPNLSAVQREFLEKALALYERFAIERSTDPRARLDAARARNRLGLIHEALGRTELAMDLHRRALEELERLSADYPDDNKCREEFAWTLSQLMGCHWTNFRTFRTSQHLREAASPGERSLSIRESLCARDPGNSEIRGDLAGTVLQLGLVYSELGRVGDAEAAVRHARDILDDLHAKSPDNVQFTMRLARAEELFAGLLQTKQRFAEADQASRRSLQLREQLMASDPKNPSYRFDLAWGLTNLKFPLAGQLEHVQLEAQLDRASRSVEILSKLAEEFPDRPRYSEILKISRCDHVNSLLAGGRASQAEAVLRLAIASAERLAADFPGIAKYRMVLAAELDQMVLVLETLGKADEADVLSGRASAIWDRLLAEFPDYKPVAAEGARRPAEWLLSAPGRDPERALALTRRVVELDPKDQLGWKWLGVAEYRSGHWAAAIEAAEKCIALRGDGGWAFQFLVIALSHARLGNTDRAREWYAKAGRPLGNEEMADTPRWLILEAASLLGAERPRDEAKPKVPGKPTHPPG